MTIRRLHLLPVTALITGLWAPAWAQAPQIVDGSINMFRDNRGANSLGIGAGNRVQYGANIVGGSAGVTLTGIAANGFIDPTGPCGPLTVSPGFCSNSAAYSAARLDPWQFQFTRGTDTTTVTGPSLAGAAVIPFPSSVTMSGTGLSPTISWALPAGLSSDGFRVQIFDKSTIRTNGFADIIYSTSVAPSATSFTLPAGAGLSSTGSYAINFQVIDTRDGLAFTGNNAQILSRSNSYFDFAPLSGNVPDDVALPTIDAAGVYNFSVGGVGPDHVTYIDPEVAIGYDYAIGATGPNFLSLLLPDIGDGFFNLDYNDGTGAHSVSLEHDQQFFFGAGGVSAFRVTGIETSAMLDPSNATAFITGVSFVSAGDFTGTMTPLTVDVTAAVPEPGTWALMLLGMGAVALARRRRGVTPALIL